eukprot:GAFH01004822.1.p2 GENE.GAFH01004822.1~~GAFH01004822.1.p2  ORF type:complete len:182 (-),score=26.57 GAFH01004822.1:122-667(-)
MSDGDCCAALCCAACLCCCAAAATEAAENEAAMQRKSLMASETATVQYVVSPGTQLIFLNNVRMVGGEIYPEFRLSPLFSFARGFISMAVDGSPVLKLTTNQPCKINVSLLAPGPHIFVMQCFDSFSGTPVGLPAQQQFFISGQVMPPMPGGMQVTTTAPGMQFQAPGVTMTMQQSSDFKM